jgi:hypothetical protein
MPITQIGHVYYADDPHQRVFRKVYPTRDDSELDGPVTDGNGNPYLDASNQPISWQAFGVDPARTAVHDKVSASNPPKRLNGTPSTPATEPVIYWVNADPVIASLTPAEGDQLNAWLAANPQWSNNFVDLGTGSVPTLTAQCVAPCWIVVVGGGTPAIGTLSKSATIHNTPVALWIA